MHISSCIYEDILQLTLELEFVRPLDIDSSVTYILRGLNLSVAIEFHTRSIMAMVVNNSWNINRDWMNTVSYGILIFETPHKGRLWKIQNNTHNATASTLLYQCKHVYYSTYINNLFDQ